MGRAHGYPRRWFNGASLLHLPAYSLVGEPLGAAARRAIDLARAAGGLVSLDHASAGPKVERGRRAAIGLVRDTEPDLLFATAAGAEALVDADRRER